MVEILGRERRRNWSTEEKMRIVAEASQPGISASWVARRHDIAPSQLFDWRKKLRKQQEEAFLPVVISEAERSPPAREHGCARCCKIDITLANGHRLSVPRHVGPADLERLLAILART